MDPRFLFHPIFIHFPIAFYFLELLLLLFWMRKGKFIYHRFAVFSFGLGYLFMIAAAVTGWVDSGGFGRMSDAGKSHFYAALALLAFYSVRILYLRFADPRDRYHAMIQISGAVIGNILVILTAYLGGKLVY